MVKDLHALPQMIVVQRLDGDGTVEYASSSVAYLNSAVGAAPATTKFITVLERNSTGNAIKSLIHHSHTASLPRCHQTWHKNR